MRIDKLIAAASFYLAIAFSPAAGGEAGDTYRNPIVAGTWSDPGVIRVGEDYYSACSTQGWQPGAHIIHSKDLMHWGYVGHAFKHHPDVPRGRSNAGIWGLEIGYNPNNKTFLLYVPTNRGRVTAYYSADPAGPYKAKYMGRLGTDPGFFVDGGRLYLLFSERATIFELTDDGLSIKREVVKIKRQGIPIFEGPDLLKRGQYYYLVYNSHGTGPHQGGRIGTMRAKQLEGPWEVDPGNPQLATDEKAELQGPQHPTLIQTQAGEWFCFYHAHDLKFYSLGRVMCMEPIRWTDDGWWRPAGGRIPTVVNKKPNLPEHKLKLADTDEFDAAELGLQWFFHCKPGYSGAAWSLTEKPGSLRVRTLPGDISKVNSLQNVFLQRVHLKRFTFEAKVTFDAQQGREAAGIHMYHDPKMNFWLASTVQDGKKTIEVGKYNNGTRTDMYSVPNTIGNTVQLKIIVDGREGATCHYSGDGRVWKQLGKRIYFGNSWRDLRDGRKGDPDLGWVGWKWRNKWNGATFGVFAKEGGAPLSKNADFSYLRVTGLE